MDAAEIDVDAIVREVTRRLGAAPDGAAPAQTDATTEKTEKSNPPGQKERDPHSLTISDRIVSIETVEGRLEGVRQLVVTPTAVVTPAVKDVLQRRRIELVRCDKLVGKSLTKFVLGAVADDSNLTQYNDILAKAGATVTVVGFAGLTAVLADMTAVIGRAQVRGVLVTPSPIVAVCLANRTGGVRAATACDRAAVREAIRQIGVNLLVIDARLSGRGPALAVDDFARSDPGRCPPELQ